MKKRYILMAVTAALVFAVAAGGTLAAQQAQGTTAVGASLEAPRLSILWNSFRPMSDGAVDLSDVSPGGYRSLDETYSVYNQGNVPAYVRVTVTKYWGEPTGEVDEYGFPLYEKRTDLDSSLVTLNPAENDGWMSARKVMTPLAASSLAAPRARPRCSISALRCSRVNRLAICWNPWNWPLTQITIMPTRYHPGGRGRRRTVCKR